MNKEPLVSVLRGNPTDLELAALVTVVAARSATVDVMAPIPTVSAWARSARPQAKPATWRTSALPR